MSRFFFFNDTATTEIYTLSLHDALPISWSRLFERRESPVMLVLPFSQPDSGKFMAALMRRRDRKSTRLNSSHSQISYAVFCLKKKKNSKTTACLCIAHTCTPSAPYTHLL